MARSKTIYSRSPSGKKRVITIVPKGRYVTHGGRVIASAGAKDSSGRKIRAGDIVRGGVNITAKQREEQLAAAKEKQAQERIKAEKERTQRKKAVIERKKRVTTSEFLRIQRAEGLTNQQLAQRILKESPQAREVEEQLAKEPPPQVFKITRKKVKFTREGKPSIPSPSKALMTELKPEHFPKERERIATTEQLLRYEERKAPFRTYAELKGLVGTGTNWLKEKIPFLKPQIERAEATAKTYAKAGLLLEASSTRLGQEIDIPLEKIERKSVKVPYVGPYLAFAPGFARGSVGTIKDVLTPATTTKSFVTMISKPVSTGVAVREELSTRPTGFMGELAGRALTYKYVLRGLSGEKNKVKVTKAKSGEVKLASVITGEREGLISAKGTRFARVQSIATEKVVKLKTRVSGYWRQVPTPKDIKKMQAIIKSKDYKVVYGLKTGKGISQPTVYKWVKPVIRHAQTKPTPFKVKYDGKQFITTPSESQVISDVKGTAIIDPSKFRVVKTKTATGEILVSLKKETSTRKFFPKKTFKDFTIGFAADAEITKVYKKGIKTETSPLFMQTIPFPFERTKTVLMPKTGKGIILSTEIIKPRIPGSELAGAYGVITGVKSKEKQDVTVGMGTASATAPMTSDFVNIKLREKLEPRLEERQKQLQESELFPPITQTEPIITTRTTQDVTEKTGILPILKQPTTVKTKKTPPPPIIKKTYTPPTPLLLPYKKTKRSDFLKEFKGFKVLTKTPSSGFRVASNKLFTRKGAISYGARLTDITTATAFRIRKAHSRAPPLRYPDYYRKFKFKFKQEPGLVFVEKEQYRFDFPSEGKKKGKKRKERRAPSFKWF